MALWAGRAPSAVNITDAPSRGISWRPPRGSIGLLPLIRTDAIARLFAELPVKPATRASPRSQSRHSEEEFQNGGRYDWQEDDALRPFGEISLRTLRAQDPGSSGGARGHQGRERRHRSDCSSSFFRESRRGTSDSRSRLLKRLLILLGAEPPRGAARCTPNPT